MKRIATGLLFVAAAIYLPARWYESLHPAIGFVRAFCEAAMIGGLADWFAVTALFRHPLGVPLPHTAIIPNNKERIAEALARFVEFNFLSTEVVTEKLAKIDFTLQAAQWMADAARSGPAMAKITEFLPRIFAMPGTEPLRRYAREHSATSLAQVDLAPAVMALLNGLASDAGSQLLVDEMALRVAPDLGASEQDIRLSIERHTTRLWPTVDLEADSTRHLIAAVARALAGLQGEAGHPARRQLAQVLAASLAALRDSPTLASRLESFKGALLTSPVWADFASTVWDHISRRLQEDLPRSDSNFRAALQGAVRGLGENLVGNTIVRMVLNMQIRQFLVAFVEKRRHHAAELIADTMRTWDAVTMSGRIEDAIGRDLQYIRINGTLIGGLIGVIIHGLSGLAMP